MASASARTGASGSSWRAAAANRAFASPIDGEVDRGPRGALARRRLDPRGVDLDRAAGAGVDHHDEQQLGRARALRDVRDARGRRDAVRREPVGGQLATDLEPADRVDVELGRERVREILAQRIDARGVEVDRDARHDRDA